MKKLIITAVLFVAAVMFLVTVISFNDPEAPNWTNRDGMSQLAKMDQPAPLRGVDELKASPFEQSLESKVWNSHDGVWSLKAEAEKFEVEITFINGNPGQTQLGLARFYDWNVPEGRYTEYEIMDIRWDESNRTVKLAPGHYGVTQYREMPGQSVMEKIKEFYEFDVENIPFEIVFQHKEMTLPNNVM